MQEIQTMMQAVGRLHAYLMEGHWTGQALAGPDPGIRLNSRFGRFLKSYLSFMPWRDDYIYYQAQGYWILDNWLMYDYGIDSHSAQIAVDCSRFVLMRQTPEGCWEYPNPEWKGRIATVEGDFAALGLLASYHHTGDEALLEGAKRWYRFLVDRVGFQGDGEHLAVNYFANVPTPLVPNNTTLTLLTCATLARETGSDEYLSLCTRMVAWLRESQLGSGELPYSLPSVSHRGRAHYLCYQYNAFEFLDLIQYSRMAGDPGVWQILERLANYLASGVRESGAARYDCLHASPEVPYYTAALGAALTEATAAGLGSYRPQAERAYSRVFSQQQEDGAMRFFSQGNYGVLADRRSYPRYLSMILHHLLLKLVISAPSVRPPTPTPLLAEPQAQIAPPSHL